MGHIQIWHYFSLVFSLFFNKLIQWFLKLALFSLIVKLNKIKESEIKSHGTCANLKVFFLIYKVAHFSNDFWNLFLDKVYHKKWVITVPEEKCTSFKGALEALEQCLSTEKALKMMKNAFYSSLKALFVLKIFKFLFWRFALVGKWLD